MTTFIVFVLLTIFLESVRGGFQCGKPLEIRFREYDGKIGLTLRFYKLEEVVGTGTHGTVYKARLWEMDEDKGDLVRTEEIFGVKITEEKNLQDRYTNEYLASKELHGGGRVNGISYIYGTGEVNAMESDDEGIALVTDLLVGQELFEFAAATKDKMMKLNIALTFMAQILPSLEILQNKKMIHRDLKPENIFITKINGCIVLVLLDFDAALFKNSLVRETRIGTIWYACINQLLRESGKPFQPDNDVNIWRSADDLQAAIVSFYFITTGIWPWEKKKASWGDKDKLIAEFIADLKAEYGEGTPLFCFLSEMFLEATNDDKRKEDFRYDHFIKEFAPLRPSVPLTL